MNPQWIRKIDSGSIVDCEKIVNPKCNREWIVNSQNRLLIHSGFAKKIVDSRKNSGFAKTEIDLLSISSISLSISMNPLSIPRTNFLSRINYFRANLPSFSQIHYECTINFANPLSFADPLWIHYLSREFTMDPISFS